jgi:hypothetical protein
VTVQQSPPAGTAVGLGEHLITFTVSDAALNQATCTALVTVVDLTPPELACAPNKSVECATAWVFDEPVATDACGTNTLTVVGTATNTGCGQTYVATRTWRATDAAGNFSECSQVVTVVDLTAPELTCAPNKSVECATAWTFDEPVATDACGTNTLTVVDTVTNGLSGGTYVATRVWQAVDACGNSATCTQVVTVVDTTAPGITFCPGARSLGVGNNCQLVLPDLRGEVVAADLCGSVTVQQSPPAGTAVGLGEHLITFTVSDAALNQATCTLTLDVVDTTAPIVLTCATNVTLIAGSNCTAFVPDLTGQITATDCSAYSITQNPATGSELGLGTYVLTFSILDASSNITTCVRSLIVAAPPDVETNISISEFMAKNVTSIVDEDGVHGDWIEIHNAGTCPLNLNGWSLTDDATKLTKWRFPATNIAAGQFMVVWASNNNRRTPGAPLHTNFKMADEGEYLALVRPDGVTIATQFSPTFPPQLPDVSYGLAADWATNNYLAWPTPGAPNSPGTNFAMENLTIGPARGWFTNSVSVSITSPTTGVTIYYTTNGTVPSASNGIVYTAGLVFSNTTVLRAVAYRPGYTPTASDGHTYIFPDQVASQTGASFPTNWGYMTNVLNVQVPVPAFYALSSNILNDAQSSNLFHVALLSLPTLSVVMNTDDMFGTNGIYSNPFGDGVAWERPCSIEYFRPDANPGFQINCGIRIQGGLSRDPAETSKHKLRLLFKQIYGSAFLVYDLYPNSPVNEFATLSLNAAFEDHWRQAGATAQMQRDEWCAQTQDEIGGKGPHGTYVNLYINGLYWGLYYVGERPDGSYGAHYFGGQKSDYDAFSGPAELTDGNWDAWNEMMAISNAGITNDIAYTNLTHYLDVPTFIDYLLINFYAANQDWPGNNWRAVGSVQKGVPFHFFSWDAEVTFYGTNWDSTGIHDGAPGLLYAALRQYPEFRQLFGDHAQRLLFNGGALTPQRCADRWMLRAQEIDPDMVAESARWGNVGFGIFTKADWLQEQNLLLTEWFPQRTDILIAQLRNAGMYPALDAPVFSPHGGTIIGSLTVTISAPAGTIYYTTNGSDPRLPGGAVSPDALAYGTGVILTNSGPLRARAFATNTWSALAEADYLLANVVDLRLRNITRQSDGDVLMEFTAMLGASYTLSASTNLIHWEILTTLTPSTDGTFSYVDHAAGSWPARFYRLTSP